MKKTICLLAALTMIVASTSAQLLWQISGNTLEKPSYVVGSHHIVSASMMDSISGLREAISEVSKVYGEVRKDDLASPKVQQQMLMMSMAPADSTLDKVLTEEELARVDAVFTKYTGIPGLIHQLKMLKPVMVSTQLAVFQTAGTVTGFDPTNGDNMFDVAVMAYGESLGKENDGLETAQEQLSILFDQPIAQQARELMASIDADEELLEQARLLTDAFYAQDLDQIFAITTSEQYGMSQSDLDRLIYNRNHAWVEKLKEILPTQNILLVVGAAHLPGQEGLLNLLQQQGYTVKPVSRIYRKKHVYPQPLENEIHSQMHLQTYFIAINKANSLELS